MFTLVEMLTRYIRMLTETAISLGDTNVRFRGTAQPLQASSRSSCLGLYETDPINNQSWIEASHMAIYLAAELLATDGFLEKRTVMPFVVYQMVSPPGSNGYSQIHGHTNKRPQTHKIRRPQGHTMQNK